MSHRCCSQPLQRAVTDLGADVSFGQTVAKLKEHYGVTLPEEGVRRIVERHAEVMFDERLLEEAWPTEPGHPLLVAQIDGGMIPIVQTDSLQKDRRKGKQLGWKEAKLCLVHPLGSLTPRYGGTVGGGVDEAGRQLFDCALQARFGHNSRVHALGDGAVWIALQIEERFGGQGQFLVDFYHVSQYLGEAAHGCSPEPRAWLETQKQRLKSNQADSVLAELVAHGEPPAVADEQAPIRRCHRYLAERRHQLDYQGALQQGLPIGSGEIESSHRYLAQERLKRPGAWWTLEHAGHMLALRLNRANGRWEQYWQDRIKQAA